MIRKRKIKQIYIFVKKELYQILDKILINLIKLLCISFVIFIVCLLTTIVSNVFLFVSIPLIDSLPHPIRGSAIIVFAVYTVAIISNLIDSIKNGKLITYFKKNWEEAWIKAKTRKSRKRKKNEIRKKKKCKSI